MRSTGRWHRYSSSSLPLGKTSRLDRPGMPTEQTLQLARLGNQANLAEMRIPRRNPTGRMDVLLPAKRRESSPPRQPTGTPTSTSPPVQHQKPSAYGHRACLSRTVQPQACLIPPKVRHERIWSFGTPRRGGTICQNGSSKCCERCSARLRLSARMSCSARTTVGRRSQHEERLRLRCPRCSLKALRIRLIRGKGGIRLCRLQETLD